ncbi:hypothetical protein IEQ34_004300 [Dendrobium chrysotoxum]|uniref:NAD-dependent epimerase/dehydratase domain-containing protein n=1 Tax=Dendrobium chrysotoxum TaxID=161865 RepID=A0AAV7HFI8_DENCH|nr:hypothetical protein IEQ34_004300 [Dendrobium chrysotoxum]
MIGAGGFIGSHLCEKLMTETPHMVLAVDVYNDKIKLLLEQPAGRSHQNTINLAAICTLADYNKRPLDTIYSNFIDALPVVALDVSTNILSECLFLYLFFWCRCIFCLAPELKKKMYSIIWILLMMVIQVRYCSENGKRLILFSTCEVFGKTIGSFLPKDHPLRKPRVQRMVSSLSLIISNRIAYGVVNGFFGWRCLRSLNWIGSRMDFIPGVDGPSEGVPRVLACFSNNLLRREPLKLVDGGQSLRSFVCIKDAIEAVLLMIVCLHFNQDPFYFKWPYLYIFNVGNPKNEVTVKQLAEIMTKSCVRRPHRIISPPLEVPTIDVSSEEFYGEGYDDSDRRVPEMTIINRQLSWNPKTSLHELLASTLTYQRKTYAKAIKRMMENPTATS